ncbi:hypothetical protein QTN25_003635 [Entamoeba marina]
MGVTDLNQSVFIRSDHPSDGILVIPSSVTSIQCFPNVDNLNSLVLPTTIKSLPIHAYGSLDHYKNLKSISFSPKCREFKFDVPYWVYLLMKTGGTHCPRVVFTFTDAHRYGLPIPDCVYKSLRSFCFYGCNSTSISLPSTLTQIDTDCVNSNTKFTSVKMDGCKTFKTQIPYSLASLLEKSGTHCTNVILDSVNLLDDNFVIPETIISIGKRCFYSFEIEVTIPTSVTKECWCVYVNLPYNGVEEKCLTCEDAYYDPLRITMYVYTGLVGLFLVYIVIVCIIDLFSFRAKRKKMSKYETLN